MKNKNILKTILVCGKNTKTTIYIFSFITIIFLEGCKKKIECDNAQLCVKNIGTDKIYYCWGCSFYSDSILPGNKACKYVGAIEITSSSESVVWVDFSSSKGSYRIKVDDCYVEKEIQ